MKFSKSTLMAAASLLSGVLAVGQNYSVGFQSGLFQIGGSNFNGAIVVDGDEHWGVVRTADDLAKDFGKVTGKSLKLQVDNCNDKTGIYEYYIPEDHFKYHVKGPFHFNAAEFSCAGLTSDTVIIAGSVDKSRLIQQLEQSGKIDVSAIRGEWEAYKIQPVEQPFPGVARALVVAGADRRGTIHALYDLAEQIGVSPLYDWADVPVSKHSRIYAIEGERISPAPSIQYRGIFINDEAPSLANWLEENFETSKYGGSFTHLFYSRVFELVLRLRGNYLWPAMWAVMFNVDDIQNQPLADAYGVVMGTSHTEPMMRATHEWPIFGEGIWQWDINNASIKPYFEFGIERAKPYESIYTMAMRGFDDTTMNLGKEDAIKALVGAVETQRELLQKHNTDKTLSEIPQMWCIYKEVQGYFEGGMEVPDDVILLWSDDNWGNIRRLPLPEEQERSGGAGIYYHFQYVGRPRSYKWINTVSLQRAWEQLHLAYERKANKVWILNVGDIKPLEVPINFYFDLAHDVDNWNYDSVKEWILQWAIRDFGEDQGPEIADLFNTYCRYTAWRKFESVDADTFSTLNYNEADITLQKWDDLASRAEAVNEQLPPVHRPAFFETVLHPIKAGQAVYSIYINAGRNYHFVEQKRSTANVLIQQIREDLDTDMDLTDEYHTLLDGKWNHMMDQTHLGYDHHHWQQPMRDALPPVRFVQHRRNSVTGTVGFGVEGSYASIPGDDPYHVHYGSLLSTPPMDPYGPQRHIDIFSRGKDCGDWKILVNDPFISVDIESGTVCGTDEKDQRSIISVDWDAAPNGCYNIFLNLTIIGGNGPTKWGPRATNLQIEVPLRNEYVPETFIQGFVETDGHISIEAEHATRNTTNGDIKYVVLPNLGHTLSGVTLWPVVIPESQQFDTAPMLEYDVYVFSDVPTANITMYISPSLNHNGPVRPLKYGIAIDGGAPVESQFVPDAYDGKLPNGWEEAVKNNAWKYTTTHHIPQGKHTIKLYAIEPGVIFQKMVVDFGGVRQSYFGPPESYYIGGDDDDEDKVKQQMPQATKIGMQLPQATQVEENEGASATQDTSSYEATGSVSNEESEENGFFEVGRSLLQMFFEGSTSRLTNQMKKLQ